MAEIKTKYGTQRRLTIAALQGLANSATVGWKSELIDNRTTLAIDFKVHVKLAMANSAPANDKNVYVFLVPLVWDTDTSTWLYCDGGTATLPSAGDASYTIANPHSLPQLMALSYTTQNQPLGLNALVSSVYGNNMPEGFLLLVVNYSGAAISPGQFSVTCSSANATTGATYTNNGVTFTVVSTIASGTTLLLTGDGIPSTSGTLTKASGTGDATITFSAFSVLSAIIVKPITLTVA